VPSRSIIITVSTILTLAEIAANPDLLTFNITIPSGDLVLLRPLLPEDVALLAAFLNGLSEQTRRFWNMDDYGVIAARGHCDSIAKYDKLRFVAISTTVNTIIALLEFSLAIPENDETRYSRYGISLSSTDCRFGPCIADVFQGKGVAVALFPYMVNVAKNLGKYRIILWGGVFAENQKAVRFYYKVGFQLVGDFLSQDGRKCLDMMLPI